jgi:soluble lytic murein transglycosylase
VSSDFVNENLGNMANRSSLAGRIGPVGGLGGFEQMAPTLMARYYDILSGTLASILAAAAAMSLLVEPSLGETRKDQAATGKPAVAAPSTRRAVAAASVESAGTAAGSSSSPDIAAVREAIGLIRHHKSDQATAIEATMRDPVARKVVEWAILRSNDTVASFDRQVAFITANPGWPSVAMLHRRAEDLLWSEHRSAATVLEFFGNAKPTTVRGKFALARALLAEGDRAGAEHYARLAWDNDSFSRDLEAEAYNAFGDLLTTADDKARMDARLANDDIEAGTRAAQRLGGSEPAVAKARAAVVAKAGNAGEFLDAVPSDARHDPSYMFSRIQWLRRNERIAEAAKLMLAVPREEGRLHNLDEWWVERRVLTRKLLDMDDAETAYRITRDALPPPRENYRGEQQFTAGWIALRFLGDPGTAQKHFARIAEGTSNPITLARAHYWQGRAAEEARRMDEARAQYEAAARYPTAYYGQIARARLGMGEIALRRMAEADAERGPMNLEVVKAIAILYEAGARELVTPAVADLAERANDTRTLAALAELTARHDDARATLLIGKGVLGRGYAFDSYAFPTLGVPHYGAIGPAVDRSVIYSIARQESEFDQKCVSTAHAYGIMQVTPEAGRYVAGKFHVGYDLHRLTTDPVYNTAMGAAELGDLLQDYRGSYILSFAAYNAGRGRVHEWVERYGDPRDPNVDPIDWVERIPFSETRNYVQRVMENLQVYRVRLGMGSRLMIEADLRAGAH